MNIKGRPGNQTFMPNTRSCPDNMAKRKELLDDLGAERLA
jgi:hypothetical protein